MFAMIKGSAKNLFRRQGKECKTFEDVMDLLRSRYTLADKLERLLTEWHGMNLTKAIEDQPEDCHMEVFRKI